jgi:putative salt-induced outer membrane protein
VDGNIQEKYMKNKCLSVMLLAGSLVGPVLAQDAAEEESGPWSGEIALGYLSAQGNTDSTSATFEFKVGYAVNAWHHDLGGRAFGSSEEGVTTAENYKLAWKSAYDFTAKDYTFGTLDWNKNRFSGYPQQTFAIVGYGRRVLDSEKFVLNLEAGVGYADQKKIVDDVLGIEENEDGGVGRLGGNFIWNFSDTANFEQLLNVSAASANTYWESVSRVRASLIGSLSLGISYTVQANSDVAPGIEKSDRFTAITLDYTF